MPNLREALEQAYGEEIAIRAVSWPVIEDGLAKLAGTPALGQVLTQSKRLQQAVFRTAAGSPINEPTRGSRCLLDVMISLVCQNLAMFSVDARMNIVRITISFAQPDEEADVFLDTFKQLQANNGAAVSVSTRRLIYDMLVDRAPKMPKWLPSWKVTHPGAFFAISEKDGDAFPPMIVSLANKMYVASWFLTHDQASQVTKYVTTPLGKKRAAVICEAVNNYSTISF